MPLNGSPTCVCGPGYAAVNIGGSLTCALVQETYLANQLLWPEWPPVVDLGDDDDTVSTDDDDDVSTDDDDDDDGETPAGNQPDDYQGLDSSINCACSTAASGSPGMFALALLGLVGFGFRRRRLI
jgi:MYXO-CTERM domain-containing protein